MTRSPMLAKVHIAKKDLALADAEYRAIVLRVTGQSSAADCDAHQLDALLGEFRRLGWVPKAKAAAPGGKAHVGLIFKLWRELGEAGALTDPSDAALRAFVRRQTATDVTPQGVAAPQFLNPKQAAKVIEGLKAWRARVRAGARA